MMSRVLLFPFDEEHSCLLQQNRCLENWKRWVEIRKKFQKKVSAHLNRNPADMVLNSGESFRNVLEERTVCEYTRIVRPSRDRGHPFFWEVPDLRSKKCPSLKYVPTKQQRGIIPDIDYVTVPNFIRQEKGMLRDSGTQTKQQRETNSHNKKRIAQLKKKMQEVQPHKPDLEHLVLFGKTEKDIAKERSRQTPPRSDERSKKSTAGSERINLVASLEIEDKTYSSMDRHQKNVNHCVSMSYDISGGDAKHVTLTIKNVGDVVVRYRWKRIFEDGCNLDVLPQRHPKYSFIFRKNEDAILPGSRRCLAVHLSTVFLGIHKETWELLTEPSVFTVGRFRVVLWANVEDKRRSVVAEAVRNRIEEGMKHTIVNDVVEDVYRGFVRCVSGEATCDKFWLLEECDIFEAVNTVSVKPHRCRHFAYNAEVVSQMKAVYEKLRTPRHPTEWNLDLRVLRDLVGRSEWCGDTERFRWLYRSLRMTTKVDMRVQDKYDRVYEFLCAAVERMSDAVAAIRRRMRVRKVDRYPRDNKDMVMRSLQTDSPMKNWCYYDDEDEEDDKPQRMERPRSGGDDGSDSAAPPPLNNQKGKKKGKEKPEKDKGTKKNDKKGQKTAPANEEDQSNVCSEPIKKLSLSFLIDNSSDSSSDEETLSSLETVESIEEPAYRENLYCAVYSILGGFADRMDEYLRLSEPSNEDPSEMIRALAAGGHLTREAMDRPRVFATMEDAHRAFEEATVDDEPVTEEESDLSDLRSVYSSKHSLLVFSHVPRGTEFVDVGTGSDCEVGPPRFQDKEVQTDDSPDGELLDLEAFVENEVSCTSKHVFDRQFEDSREDLHADTEDASVINYY